jgi:hypothetical protein
MKDPKIASKTMRHAILIISMQRGVYPFGLLNNSSKGNDGKARKYSLFLRMKLS